MLKTNTHASIEQSVAGVLVVVLFVMIRHGAVAAPDNVGTRAIGERRAFCQLESQTLELL
jgi:hypothetical protein